MSQQNRPSEAFDAPLARGSRIRACEHLVSCDLGDETVILNMDSGIYFSIDSVGTYVWQQFGDSVTVEKVVTSVVDAFDVAPQQCYSDVVAFVMELRDAGLVAIEE